MTLIILLLVFIISPLLFFIVIGIGLSLIIFGAIADWFDTNPPSKNYLIKTYIFTPFIILFTVFMLSMEWIASFIYTPTSKNK
jgi:hypothetical protein